MIRSSQQKERAMIDKVHSLPKEYRCRVEREFSTWGSVNTSFIVVGDVGALSLHIGEHGNGFNPTAGLETHSRYSTGSAPDHDRCHVLGGAPCWHDGTSLYASEHWLPMFGKISDEEMLRQLCIEADRQFEGIRIKLRALDRFAGGES
jgi:hypothetical protein